MNQKSKKKYSEEFKTNAVNLVLIDGLSVYKAARQTKIPKSTLANWVTAFKATKKKKSDEIDELELSKPGPNRLKTKSNKVKERESMGMSVGDNEMVPIPTNNTQLINPYNDMLLEQAKEQWRIGDWEGLVKMELEVLLHHPDRAKLALLVAAGYQQQNNIPETKRWVKQSLVWGIDKKVIARVLIGGVHHVLGTIALINNQEHQAQMHFCSAAKGVNCDSRITAHMRAVGTSIKSGLLKQAASQINNGLNNTLSIDEKGHQIHLDDPRIKVLQTEMELIQHELSLAHQRQQLFQFFPENSQHDEYTDNEKWLNALKKRAVSQLGQELWVLEKTDYKRNGYFVEFGATDGILLSNSFLLEKEFGWQGVCAEPNPAFFNKLKNNRSCKVSNACIGTKTGEKVSFVYAGEYGGMLKYVNNDMHAEKRQAYAKIPEKTTELETISLNDFLILMGAPYRIDYLSIDTEGSEFDILNSFPFEKWHIRLITVEHNFAPLRNDIRALLEENGYQCTEQRWDDWYELLEA